MYVRISAQEGEREARGKKGGKPADLSAKRSGEKAIRLERLRQCGVLNKIWKSGICIYSFTVRWKID